MPKSNFLNHHLIFLILGVLSVLGLAGGCQTRASVTELSSETVRLEKIMVLRFIDVTRMVTLMSASATDTRCPVGGRVFMTGKVEAAAAAYLTDQTFDLLKRHTDYEIIPGRVNDDLLAALFTGNQSPAVAKNLLADKGRDKDTDAVLVGFVYRFRERVGKGYGAESPASVAFDMHLIHVADSRNIWSAHFNETQKSLGDNLFRLGSFISRGGRWLTAKDLADSGLEEIFEKFPKN
jgi:hypothetical protein